MAEGDTILRLARRLERALAGEPLSVRTPGARRPQGLSAGLLDGRALERAESRGKHLLLHFSGDVVLHSHLGMKGSWDLYRQGEPWLKPARSAWVAIAGGGFEAVNFHGSSMRVVRHVRLARDPRLARLGPDILSDSFDPGAAAAAIRPAAAARELGDALIDQSLLAGVGNIFKSEGCFEARVSPWRRVAELDGEELAGVLAATRTLMAEAARSGRQPGRVYGRRGRPCPRCGSPLESGPQGDSARTTYWCPGCQPARALSEAG